MDQGIINAEAASVDSKAPILREIGWAVKQMHNGDRVRRRGWNGKGMWIGLWQPHDRADGAVRNMTLPYVYMRTAQGDLVPWLCSQTDLLALDWEIAPNG